MMIIIIIMEKTLTNDDAQKSIMAPMSEVFGKVGITPEYLAKKHKSELNAKETKTIKLKGAIRKEDLAKGYRVIGVTGRIVYLKDGEEIYGDGETIIAANYVSWATRQKAREDAQKLLGLYPAQKHELTFPDGLTIDQISPERRNRAKRAAQIAAELAKEESGLEG